jgi:hypothetical protein
MSPNWNPRTIFIDVREVSIAIANGAPPKPDSRGGNRLLCAIKMRPWALDVLRSYPQ